MDAQPAENLLPMTILDAMILVAGCAVSAWLLAGISNNSYVHPYHPEDLADWLILTAFPQYGPTVVGPFLIGLQFWRGRRQRLMPGEIAWLVIGMELLPYCVLWATDPGPRWIPQWCHDLLGWYMDPWLTYCSPPLVLVCAVIAWVWHFRVGRPRHWLHRMGLAISLTQCVPSVMWMIMWF